MSLFDKLTAKNFSAFALKHYDDPQCEDMEDFQEDLRRFRYLKRLLFRYHESGELRERLLLNHLICLFNVFGYDACMRMLKFKIKEDIVSEKEIKELLKTKKRLCKQKKYS